MPAKHALQSRLFVLTSTLGISVVVIMSVIFLAVEFTHQQRHMAERLHFVAGLLNAEIGILEQSDVAQHMDRLLTALEDDPLIDLACVYDRDDDLIAGYAPAGAGSCPDHLAQAPATADVLTTPVQIGDQLRGSLLIRSASSTMYQAMLDLVFPLALLIASLVVIVLLIGRHFAQSLVNPIIELTNNAKRFDATKPRFESVPTRLREVAELSESFERVVENLISARHRAEGEVIQRQAAQDGERTSRDLLRHIVDLVPYPIFAVHRDGDVLFANQAVADLYNESLPRLLEHGFKDGYPRAGSDQLLFAPFSSQRGPIEVWFNDANDESRRFLVRWVPYIGDDTALVIGVDVTEEHRLQLQLQFSQRLEVIGTLAGGIAHDFNNLLTPILGYTTMLLESDLPSDVLSKLRAVEAAAERARDVVQQILTFSRQQKRTPTKEPADVTAVVADAAELMRATIPSTVQIRVHCEPVGKVRADPNQIHQVLVNLITNAAQSIADLSGDVDIRVFPIAAASACVPAHLAAIDYVCIEVADNGKGIPKGVINHVFEPFFTTKNVGEGSGLGLSVVHGIVTAHGGDITVDSREKEGSTFRVLLPVADEEPAVDPAAAQSGGLVMLVDDEASVLRVTSELLTNQGYEVATFSDPAMALRAFRVNPAGYDILITDHNMPAMTGAELATAARRLRPDIPIILITGFASAAASDLECIDHKLMKPISGHELDLVIRSSLASRRPAA